MTLKPLLAAAPISLALAACSAQATAPTAPAAPDTPPPQVCERALRRDLLVGARARAEAAGLRARIVPSQRCRGLTSGSLRIEAIGSPAAIARAKLRHCQPARCGAWSGPARLGLVEARPRGVNVAAIRMQLGALEAEALDALRPYSGRFPARAGELVYDTGDEPDAGDVRVALRGSAELLTCAVARVHATANFLRSDTDASVTSSLTEAQCLARCGAQLWAELRCDGAPDITQTQFGAGALGAEPVIWRSGALSQEARRRLLRAPEIEEALARVRSQQSRRVHDVVLRRWHPPGERASLSLAVVTIETRDEGSGELERPYPRGLFMIDDGGRIVHTWQAIALPAPHEVGLQRVVDFDHDGLPEIETASAVLGVEGPRDQRPEPCDCT